MQLARFFPAKGQAIAWRRLLYGYRVTDVRITANELGSSVQLSEARDRFNPVRLPMMRAMPFHLYGACLPCPDLNDTTSLMAGVLNRLGRKLPEDQTNFLARLNATTQEFISDRKLEPISPMDDRGFEAWVSRTGYPDYRKRELREINEEIIGILSRNKKQELRNFKVKLFCKEENYEGFKWPRGIYAREDVAKVFFGPYFKLMEDRVYAMKEFIKHVPVPDRPQYIMDNVHCPGMTYVTTDYSAFECHFTKDVMENCEMLLYKHMLSRIREGSFVYDVMHEVLTGPNRVFAKNFSAVVNATRMSGEMNTSLGNGFSNLMFMQTFCKGHNVPLRGVVEGDDGLFAFPEALDFSEFERSGLILKMQTHKSISTASFCGMIFEEDSRQAIANPIKIIAKLGWASRRYARSGNNVLSKLLACKLLSTGHQNSACPIVNVLCHTLLVQLKFSKYELRKFAYQSQAYSSWERERLIKAIDAGFKFVEPSMATRYLMERIFNISVEQQFRIEKVIRETATLAMFRCDELLELMPTYSRNTWDNLSHEGLSWDLAFPLTRFLCRND